MNSTLNGMINTFDTEMLLFPSSAESVPARISELADVWIDFWVKPPDSLGIACMKQSKIVSIVLSSTDKSNIRVIKLSDIGDCAFRSVDMKTYSSKSGFEIVTWVVKPLIFASVLMLAWAGFGVAQEKAQDALGVVHRDDMDIIFERAGTQGL
jgi:hypothetical protein